MDQNRMESKKMREHHLLMMELNCCRGFWLLLVDSQNCRLCVLGKRVMCRLGKEGSAVRRTVKGGTAHLYSL